MDQALYEKRKGIFQAALAKGEELAEPVTFYSTSSPGLAIGTNSGKLSTDAGGNKIRIDQKIVEFTPIATGIKQPDGSMKHYGYFTTSDPENALKLLQRAVDPKKGDICMAEEYIALVTPPEEQVRQANLRVISVENELDRYLQIDAEKDREIADLHRLSAAAVAPPAPKPTGKAAKEAAQEPVTAAAE